MPPQGVFENCNIALIPAECAQRLAVAAAAGFKIVVVPLPSYGPALSGYIHALKADRLRAMWEVSNPGWWGYNGTVAFGYDGSAASMLGMGSYASWTAACRCATNAELLAFIVRTMTSSGTTYGWYVADDSQMSSRLYSSAQALAGIKTFVSNMRSVTSTPTLMSAWGLISTTQLEQAYGIASLTAQEAYPLLNLGASSANTAWEAQLVGLTAKLTQQLADTRHGPASLILQSFSWGECDGDAQASGAGPSSRYPSAAELMAMRNAALASSHPSLILYYNLEETIGWASGEQPAGCRAPRDPAERLAALSAAVKAPYPS